jgi:NADH-quinone oxidoreductase subunit K
MIVPMGHILIVSTTLFFMGLGCILARRNLIMILIGIEIMINAAGLVLVGASALWRQADGQVFVLLLMGVTAAEVAIALAMVVYLYGFKRNLDIDNFDGMRG